MRMAKVSVKVPASVGRKYCTPVLARNIDEIKERVLAFFKKSGYSLTTFRHDQAKFVPTAKVKHEDTEWLGSELAGLVKSASREFVQLKYSESWIGVSIGKSPIIMGINVYIQPKGLTLVFSL